MTGNKPHFKDAMNRGHSAAWDQQWEKAAEFYKQALEEQPENPLALTNLGLAFFELEEYQEALTCYRRAARATPHDPLSWEKMSQLYERLGKMGKAVQASLQAAEMHLKLQDAQKALENWSRVTRLDPENMQAHSRLALVYERLGEKQKSVNSYLALAGLFQHAGDNERAMRAATHAREILPKSKEAAKVMSLLRSRQPVPRPTRPQTLEVEASSPTPKNSPPAQEQTETAKLDPTAEACQRALSVLAGVLFDAPEQETPEVTRTGFRSLMRGAGSGIKALDKTRITLHLGQLIESQTQEKYAQALEEIERAMEAGLDHPAAEYDLGYLYVKTGKGKEALPHLSAARNHPDFRLGACLLLADLMQKQEQVDRASIEYLEALRAAEVQVVPAEISDELNQLYEPIVETYRQNSDRELQSRLCSNIASLLQRSDWRAHLMQARQQIPGQNGSQLPVPLADILLEAHSNEVIEAMDHIRTLAQAGNYRSAMEEAFYALQAAPTYLPLHHYMAEVLLKQNRMQEAISKFMVIARTYSIRGQAQRTVDIYRRVINLAPMDLTARNHLIEQLSSQNRMQEAVQEYLYLGEVYYSLADLEMARTTYNQAIRLAQQARLSASLRIQILHRLADIDLQSLDWRQAVRIFEQIRSLNPGDEKARSGLVELNLRLGQEPSALGELDNYLAYLHEKGQQDKAISFLKGLVEENPERLGLRKRLAELYQQAGQVKDAIRELDLVGEALLESGDQRGAIQTIQSILALQPPNAAEYQRLLGDLRGKY